MVSTKIEMQYQRRFAFAAICLATLLVASSGGLVIFWKLSWEQFGFLLGVVCPVLFNWVGRVCSVFLHTSIRDFAGMRLVVLTVFILTAAAVFTTFGLFVGTNELAEQAGDGMSFSTFVLLLSASLSLLGFLSGIHVQST